MVYTVTVNPALDYVLELSELRFGDINRADNAHLHYGGKGINVSVILSSLGVENTALGFIGGFSGIKLKELLQKDGITTDFVEIASGDTRINVKIRAKSELDINTSGADISEEEIQKLLCKIDGATGEDLVVLAGSLPKNLPFNIYEKIAEKIHGRGVRLVVDTADSSLMSVLKCEPFLIKPNHHELGDLFGVKIKNDDDIIFYARKLQQMGAKNVLVSQAENGAILLDKNGKIIKICAAKGKFVDSVGCGDSMVAGFIAGYIKTADYEYSAKLATACGGATAFSNTLATKDEIFEVLRQLL